MTAGRAKWWTIPGAAALRPVNDQALYASLREKPRGPTDNVDQIIRANFVDCCRGKQRKSDRRRHVRDDGRMHADRCLRSRLRR